MYINLSNLKPAPGSKHKPKRIGCGEGSGHGGSGSTRGMKGQRARSGEGKNPGFEGGQMPLIRRIPKRGFSNANFSLKFQEVCIEDIERKIPKDFVEITPEILKKHGLIKTLNLPIKIIRRNSNTTSFRKCKMYAHKCSKSIAEIIKKSGGEYVQLDY